MADACVGVCWADKSLCQCDSVTTRALCVVWSVQPHQRLAFWFFDSTSLHRDVTRAQGDSWGSGAEKLQKQTAWWLNICITKETEAGLGRVEGLRSRAGQ